MKNKKIKNEITASILLLILVAGCNNNDKNIRPKTAANDTASPAKEIKQTEAAVVDSGQVWFSVSVTKNDTPYIKYEGNWPLLLSSNNSTTIQLAASKKLMSITNMLTIYLHGLPAGKVDVVLSNREKDKASMIMSQVINGNYDIPIMPSEGSINITKNTGKILSGNFEARAIDANKQTFVVTGTFLNVGVNDDRHIK
jgi:hypothetical protein